jgi:RHH-type rel operon transcriptional repressor/antitoxin RelB
MTGENMDAILTVRLDSEIKERAQAILRQKGFSASAAVQRFFDYIVQTGNLPFENDGRPSAQEIEQRLVAFTQFHTKEPLSISDEEIRAARIRERYELNAG